MPDTPEQFDARRQKAFDLYAEASKQLLSLATGIIAFSVTFSKDFVTSIDSVAKVLLVCAWLVYLVSIISGLLTLYFMAGELEPGGNILLWRRPSIWAENIGCAVKMQQVSFILALFLTAGFGFTALFFPPNQPQKVNDSVHSGTPGAQPQVTQNPSYPQLTVTPQRPTLVPSVKPPIRAKGGN